MSVSWEPKFSYELKGMDVLQKKLEALGQPTAKKITTKAANAASAVVLEAIIANAPVDTGFMKEHFRKKLELIRGGIASMVRIFPKNEFYPFPNGIVKQVKNKYGRYVTKPGRVAVAAVVSFFEFGIASKPGWTKKPFMTQAFEASHKQALDVMISTIQEEIEKVTK